MNQFNEDDINDRLQDMSDRLSEFETKINSIDTKLTQVVDAILGNPLTKSGGFVEDIKILKDRVKSLEDELDDHRDFRKKMSWTTGIVVGVLFVIYHLITLYLNFPKK